MITDGITGTQDASRMLTATPRSFGRQVRRYAVLAALLLPVGVTGCGGKNEAVGRRTKSPKPERVISHASGAGSEAGEASRLLREGMTSDEVFSKLRVEWSTLPYGTLHRRNYTVLSDVQPGRVIDLHFSGESGTMRLTGWGVRLRSAGDDMVPVARLGGRENGTGPIK
ncbi:MAG: hypothetical protein ABR915_22145 [Thermoguttaceae bacterium]|jgi:hypothetical protein